MNDTNPVNDASSSSNSQAKKTGSSRQSSRKARPSGTTQSSRANQSRRANRRSGSTRHATRATLARQLALDITMQIRLREAFAQDLIKSRVRRADIPQVERDFATLLILGVVATSGELDFLLDRSLQKGTVEPGLRDALRISVYELFFLQKEAHTVVDQGVELVRSIAPHAAGFANKLLREAARLRDSFPFGDPATDHEALAHQQAFPLWLAERLISELGYEGARLFMEASNQQPPLFLADLRLGTTLEIAPAQLQDYLPHIEAGEMLVADASAQQVAAYATPAKEGAFLEVGSGRGTKTILLLHNALRAHGAHWMEGMQGTHPQFFALDRHAYKHEILKQRLARYRLVEAATVEVTNPAADNELADHVTRGRSNRDEGCRKGCQGDGSNDNFQSCHLTRPPDTLFDTPINSRVTTVQTLNNTNTTFTTVTTVTGDATDLEPLITSGKLPSHFSGALIDAPCSGTGTLRRHPEIRWRLTPEAVTTLAAQSLSMLEAAAHHIERGGFIVYSTCSVLREENEDVIECFLASPPGKEFQLVDRPFRPTLTPGSPDAHFAAKLIRI